MTFQLFSEDADSLVAAVSGLKDLCDAVDIIDCSNSSCTEDDRWNAWLSCIQKVQQECEMPIVCKLPFSQKTVDDTIRKGNSLQEAGCKVLQPKEGQPLTGKINKRRLTMHVVCSELFNQKSMSTKTLQHCAVIDQNESTQV